jgi:hypothetical protein
MSKKNPYDQVRVRWKADTYLEGYAGGLYFPPHEPGKPSLSEPCDRLMAEQLVDAEIEHYAIYEDELEEKAVAERAAAEKAQEKARAQIAVAPTASNTAPVVLKSAGAVNGKPQAPLAQPVPVPEPPREVLTPKPPEAKPRMVETQDLPRQLAAAEQTADDDGADEDADDDEQPSAPLQEVIYAPDLKRPTTREDACEVLGLSAADAMNGARVKDAYAAAQEKHPAQYHPDHYAQATDAYNLLTLPPPPQPAPTPTKEALLDIPPPPKPPRPRRTPRAEE